MSAATIDDTLCARVREAVEAARQAEFALLEAVAALHASQVPAASGYRSTARLVGDLVRVDPAAAKRMVAQTELLSPGVAFSGEPLEPALPATAQAFADGAVGGEHVRVISRAMDAVGRVPDLDPGTVADAEELLAGHATQLSPCGVEKAATRLLAHLDPDGVAPLDPPEPDDEVSIATRRRDGALALSALIHGPTDVELVREVLDALSGPAGAEDSRSLGARRAEALLELFTQALSPTGIATDTTDTTNTPETDDTGSGETGTGETGTGETPAHEQSSDEAGPVRAPGRPLLAVTIDHEWLRLQIGHGLSTPTLRSPQPKRAGWGATRGSSRWCSERARSPWMSVGSPIRCPTGCDAPCTNGIAGAPFPAALDGPGVLTPTTSNIGPTADPRRSTT